MSPEWYLILVPSIALLSTVLQKLIARILLQAALRRRAHHLVLVQLPPEGRVLALELLDHVRKLPPLHFNLQAPAELFGRPQHRNVTLEMLPARDFRDARGPEMTRLQPYLNH